EGSYNRRSGQSSSARRKEPPTQVYAPSVTSSADTDETLVATSAAPSERASSPPPRTERSSQGRRGPTSPRRHMSSEQAYFPDSRFDPSADDVTQQQIRSANYTAEEDPTPPPTATLSQVPPSVKRYSLVDRPVSSSSPPAVVVDEPFTPPSNHDR